MAPRTACPVAILKMGFLAGIGASGRLGKCRRQGCMAGTNLELILSPEAQSFCGIAAGVMGVIGLFVWSAGIRLARPVTAIGSGLAVAGVAIWGLPQVTSLAPVTA